MSARPMYYDGHIRVTDATIVKSSKIGTIMPRDQHAKPHVIAGTVVSVDWEVCTRLASGRADLWHEEWSRKDPKKLQTATVVRKAPPGDKTTLIFNRECRIAGGVNLAVNCDIVSSEGDVNHCVKAYITVHVV